MKRWGPILVVALVCVWLGRDPLRVAASAVATQAYNLVQQAGIPLVARSTLNCSTGMSCSDDAINKVTTLTAVGSGGSVTQVNTGCALSGGPITTTGTVIRSLAVNPQTMTTYSVANSDCGKLVTFTNGSAIAVTLPQAGSGGNFLAGWEADFQNRGAGTATITPTTSTIDGAASLEIATNQGVRIFSDGTNYFTQRGFTSTTAGTVTSVGCGTGLTGGTITSTGTCAIDANSQVRSFGAGFDGGGSALTSGKTVYFTVPFACTITGYNITADTGTASFDVWRVATGTAIPVVGNSILSAFLNLSSGTALHSTSVTSFTSTAIAAFDIIGVNLQAVSGATELSLVIPCNAT